MLKNLRRFSAMAAVFAAAFLFVAATASALPSVSFVWRAPQHGAVIGTPSIAASGTVTGDIVLTGDSSGPAVIGVFVSIEYDTSELTAVSVKELAVANLPGMGNSMSPVTGGTGELTLGVITNWDSATLTTGLTDNSSRTLGSVVFHVVAATGDASDVDVITTVNNLGTDTISGAGGVTLTANHVGASVIGPAVPEPTTALLVVAGLAGLGYAGRRNLR